MMINSPLAMKLHNKQKTDIPLPLSVLGSMITSYHDFDVNNVVNVGSSEQDRSVTQFGL